MTFLQTKIHPCRRLLQHDPQRDCRCFVVKCSDFGLHSSPSGLIGLIMTLDPDLTVGAITWRRFVPQSVAPRLNRVRSLNGLNPVATAPGTDLIARSHVPTSGH